MTASASAVRCFSGRRKNADHQLDLDEARNQVALDKARQPGADTHREQIGPDHRREPVSYTHLDVYKRQNWNRPGVISGVRKRMATEYAVGGA